MDHGFDPPGKLDSGRGANSYASGYGGAGGRTNGG